MAMRKGLRRGLTAARFICAVAGGLLCFCANGQAQVRIGEGPAPDFVQSVVPADFLSDESLTGTSQEISLVSGINCGTDACCDDDVYCGEDYCGSGGSRGRKSKKWKRKSPFRDRWDGAFEIGLNGAEGDARNVNLVVGLDGKRVNGIYTTTIDVDYLFSRDEIETTKNRFYSLARRIRDIPGSRWGTFGDFWFEYDELEAFRSRVGLHGGGIYTFQDTEELVFKGLIGLGTSKEARGMDNDWRPEAFLGSVIEKQLTCRQSCFIRSIYYPDVSNVSDFRVNVRAGWDYALSDVRDVKLSLSAFNRYDSAADPGDRKNNIDYWASVIWAF